jgi:hypothetical protein
MTRASGSGVSVQLVGPIEARPTFLLVACGGKTVAIAVQPPLADRACSDAGTVRVEIDSIPADCARSVAIAVSVSVYALVADRACRSAVAVTISILVLTADPAGSIAVLISVGVHDAAVLDAGRVARPIRVQAALSIQGMNECRQEQRCKYESRHGDHLSYLILRRDRATTHWIDRDI